MSDKIFFPSAGGGTANTGLTNEQGSTYLTIDGGRGMSGTLVPATGATYSLGTISKSFSSGVFNDCLCISIFKMTSVGTELFVQGTSGANALSRASFWYTKESGVAITGARMHHPSSGQVVWSSSNTDIRQNYDTNLNRLYAGVVRVGTTESNGSGVLVATSGVFRTHLAIAAPNGSGWKITVDNSGVLATTGPFIIG
jgi:hypothetical protein